LQEGEIRPLGDTQTKKVDARVIAMTNQNLEGKIQDKSFRQDLFYRLNVVTIRNPSLEKIKDDIPLLTSFFIKKTCQELEVPEKRFSQEALREMMHKSWPGNVRELQNVIRRSVLFSNEEIISKPYFMEVEDQGQNTLSRNIAGMYDKAEMMKYMDIKEKILHDFSNRYISDLLKSTSGNVTQAAKISGLSRAALQKIINKFSIDTNAFRAQKPSR
jgi:DNA-binding NtrC family response regulator